MTTLRLSAARAAELTSVLRKRRVEPTILVLEPGEDAIELSALIGPVTVIGEAGGARTIIRARRDAEMLKVSCDGSSVILRGLTLEGGESPTGGALDIVGKTTVIVEDCVFRAIRAPQIMGGGER